MQRISQISVIVFLWHMHVAGSPKFFLHSSCFSYVFYLFYVIHRLQAFTQVPNGIKTHVVSREAKKEQSESPKTKHTTNYCVISEHFHIMMS